MFGRLRAFTLWELLIATVILVIVITGLLSLFVFCLMLNESNNNLITAVNDAQLVLEQIKGLAYSAITSYAVPSFSNLSDENATVSFSSGTKITGVTVNVSWTEKQKTRTFSLSTYIAE